VPCGQELFNDAFTIVRKYLMKTCELTQITLLPSDSFTYTTVKTCVFFFTKKKNDDDIMQRREYTKLRNPKLFYDYKFNNDDHETKSIKFYEFDKKEKNCERFIAEIPIEQIIKKNYCLDFSSYIKQDKKTYGSGVIFKKLGDICTIDYGTRILKKDNVDKNQFPVYGGGWKNIHR
jgi:type I restriction-modification system DNA methylase subunit